MKNVIILILLGVIAYLIYTSGILSRAVQSSPLNPSAVSNPGAASIPSSTPQIIVTVYSPFGTGTQTPQPQPKVIPTIQAVQPTVIVPAASPTPIPAIEAPAFTPPPPTIVLPVVPPTLAAANTPVPSANFTITLESVRDGDTTNASPLVVTGVTAPNAVVSVNDVVGVANAEGRFTLTVPLDPGPNVLEVIASKPNGEQTFVIVTVLFQP